MTAKKAQPLAVPEIQINPSFAYLINSPIAVGVIGLGPSQQKEAWEAGLLPVPPKLTNAKTSRRAYTGRQLLDIAAEREARAQAEQARLAAEPSKPPRKRRAPAPAGEEAGDAS
jgi:hypothetical protein